MQKLLNYPSYLAIIRLLYCSQSSHNKTLIKKKKRKKPKRSIITTGKSVIKQHYLK